MTALATLAIAILTGFYVRYSKAQWQVMEKALDANERAWVLVRQTGISFHPEADAQLNPERLPLLNIVNSNYGKSPAFRTRTIIRITFELKEPIAPPPDSEEWGSAIDVGIGASYPSVLVVRSMGDMEAVEKGHKPLFIWVLVRYADPFSDDRFTQSCVHYQPNPLPGLAGLVLCPDKYQIHR